MHSTRTLLLSIPVRVHRYLSDMTRPYWLYCDYDGVCVCVKKFLSHFNFHVDNMSCPLTNFDVSYISYLELSDTCCLSFFLYIYVGTLS